MIDYQHLCLKSCEIAQQAGAFIRREALGFSSNKIEVKGVHNFVSYVDKGAEKMIVEQLRLLLPEAGFITEEGTDNTRGDRFNWVIDPLDGTTNFIHGLPPYAVSIGLLDNERLVVGVVYEVTSDECFYAWENGGAYLNGAAIHVSDKPSVQDALIGTGFPYYNFELMRPYMDCLEYLMRNSHGVRRLGSAATDLSYVACGRFEVFYEYNLSPWDVAGGALILSEAGGKISDFSGGDNYIFGKEIVATNANIADEFLSIIQKWLKKK
ncbi:MAG: inositol monophosphatase [Bacteroidales bacterium]|jgi:myo-inositol-1(or 4)-monophosphatase|nr:inositol monophosphatase [Bacteroidales bacterium]